MIKKEMIKYETLKEELSEHIAIHQIPNAKNLIGNKKYMNILIDNLIELINYYNNWERLKTRMIIVSALNNETENMNELTELYNVLYEEHRLYYEATIKHFIKLKNLTRENKEIYDALVEYVLFLESIE
jgi:hypothetical protein